MREKWLNSVSRVLEYSLYGLVFFIPISNFLIEVFFTIAITVFTIKKILEKDYKFLLNKTHFFLALFFIFSALSLINSGPYLDKGFKTLVSKWQEYFLLFVICADTLKDFRIRRNCFFILAGISFFVGVDTFFQRFLGLEYFRQREMVEITGGLAGVTGPFNHYNDLGAYLVIMLSFTFAQFMVVREKIKKVSFCALTVILAAGLLMTFSRGAWLGAGIAFILMMLFLRKFKILMAFICIILLILLVVPDVRERFLFSFQKGGDATRFILWRGAWSMIEERPFFGKGLGTFIIYLPEYTSKKFVQYAHNSFLQIWAETGIFSLLSFLGFLYLILSKAIRLARKSTDPIFLGALCGVCGFLLHSFFDSQLYSLQLSILFWMIIGLLYASCKANTKTAQEGA